MGKSPHVSASTPQLMLSFSSLPPGVGKYEFHWPKSVCHDLQYGRPRIEKWLSNMLGHVAVPGQKITLHIQKQKSSKAFGDCGGKGIMVRGVEDHGIRILVSLESSAIFSLHLMLNERGPLGLSATILFQRLMAVCNGSQIFSKKQLEGMRILTPSEYQQLITGGRVSSLSQDRPSNQKPLSRRRTWREDRHHKCNGAFSHAYMSPEERVESYLQKLGIPEDQVLVALYLPTGDVANYARVRKSLREAGLSPQDIRETLAFLRGKGIIRTYGGRRPPSVELVLPPAELVGRN